MREVASGPALFTSPNRIVPVVAAAGVAPATAAVALAAAPAAPSSSPRRLHRAPPPDVAPDCAEPSIGAAAAALSTIAPARATGAVAALSTVAPEPASRAVAAPVPACRAIAVAASAVVSVAVEDLSRLRVRRLLIHTPAAL